MARLSERRRLGKFLKRNVQRARAERRLQHGHHSRWWHQGRQRLFRTKSEWGPGEWQDEPDRLEWRHASGLPCLVVRGPLGALCGYVGVPPEHPLYMRDYDDCDVRAHGGLTYSDHCQGKICHKPGPGEERDIWWLGFDCGHYRDITPSTRALLAKVDPFGIARRELLTYGDGETYRTIGYVRAEVERLAEQVAAAGRA